MGDGKKRSAALRIEVMRWIGSWNFPPTDTEQEFCRELIDGDTEMVMRASAQYLKRMRMLPRQCHQNAMWYEKHDPANKARAICGWKVEEFQFVLHSVVEIDGTLICITPSDEGESEFPFIRDENIVWNKDGEHFVPAKHGYKVGPGVRLYPALTIEMNRIVSDRILRGMHPLEALKFEREHVMELKRRYADPSIYGLDSQ